MDFEFLNSILKAKENGQEIGNIVFGKQAENVFRILRVFVDPLFRGRGIASALVAEGVKWAKQNNFLLVPVCSFAVSEFEKYPQYKDVLFTSK